MEGLSCLAIRNEVNWRFSKEEIMNGISPTSISSSRNERDRFREEDTRLRRISIAFLHDSVAMLSITMRDVAPEDMVMACFFLAGKVEETPIRARRLVNYIYRLRTQSDQDLSDDSVDYRTMKAHLLANEEILLETMGFDMLVTNPCIVLDSYLRFLNCSADSCLRRMAVNFVLDSLRTTLCLEYPTQVIVAAALTLAARRQDEQLHVPPELSSTLESKPSEWYRMFCITEIEVEDAIRQILELYKHPVVMP